jgi:hypothetical protein
MKNRGGWAALDYPGEMQYFRVAVMGNGAAAPVAPPGLNIPFVDGSTFDFPVKANALSRNAAEVPTRSGVGLYVVTYDIAFTIPQIHTCLAEVFGASGVWGQIAAWNAATRQISVRTFAAGGAAVDLLATDGLVIDVASRDTSQGKATGSLLPT